ncbi:MAG: hypothetical protein ACPG7F_00515 [Aggregatilineales bacterium]
MTMVLAAVLTMFWTLRAAGSAHLKAATADGETQSAVATLALAGHQHVNDLLQSGREIAELRVKIAKLEGDIKVLKEKEAHIPILDAQIEQMTMQITEIQEAYTKQVDALEAQNKQERQQNALLMDENEHLKTIVIPGLKEQIEKLQARVTELESELGKIKNGGQTHHE